MGLTEMVGRLKPFDISLVKLATAAAVLLIAKYWPVLTSFEWYWYVVVFAIASFMPLKHMFSE